METENFGEHLTIDGYFGDRKKLADRDIIINCLDSLPDLLHMKKLSSSNLFYAPANDIKDPGGWSGFIVIAESHISIHTFPERGFLSADVYTCKNELNVQFILSYFVDIFMLREIEHNLLKRGTRYPIRNIYN
jgi:S-adenosylmethionine decarboxylase